MTALLIGFILVALLGAAHHGGMIAIRRVMPPAKAGSQQAILVGYCGLLLHTLEILAFAALYRWFAPWPWMGSMGPDFDNGWPAFVYYSGMNFVTLGFGGFDVNGPIRLVGMMQALGGFMVLTWSATFIYSISAAMWERPGD